MEEELYPKSPPKMASIAAHFIISFQGSLNTAILRKSATVFQTAVVLGDQALLHLKGNIKRYKF